MNEYGQYGAIGGMLVACFVAIQVLVKWLKKKDEEHSKEREEWLKTFDNIVDKTDKTVKETNTVIRENSTILAGLKALLENQNRINK